MSDSNLSEQKKSFNIWKWFGIGCGGCLLTSILAIAGLGYFIYTNLQFSTDPQKVEARAKAIFDYEISGGSRGLLTFEILDIKFAQVTNITTSPQVVLTVGQTPQKLSGDLQEISISIQQAQDLDLNIESEEIADRQLCGQTVQVLIQKGKFNFQKRFKEPKQASSHTAIVNYNDTGRFVWVLAVGEESEAEATKVFDSLECK
ncbi:MAG: hypothetical protein QNJ38_18245 [Prochloraceae cyanobacterium]|nr:hypothetical protein [Prochloraceae cyanobacterium]